MASINVGTDILKSIIFVFLTFYFHLRKKIFLLIIIFFFWKKKALKKMTPIDKTKPIGSLHKKEN